MPMAAGDHRPEPTMTLQIVPTTRTWTWGRMLTAATVVAVLVSAAALSACGGGDKAVLCTAEARTSVMVSPVDGQGRPLTGVQVSYRVDGGALFSLTCDTSCAVGVERAGSFSLTASKAGYATATSTVQVLADVCHVQTERWQPTLRQL